MGRVTLLILVVCLAAAVVFFFGIGGLGLGTVAASASSSGEIDSSLEVSAPDSSATRTEPIPRRPTVQRAALPTPIQKRVDPGLHHLDQLLEDAIDPKERAKYMQKLGVASMIHKASFQRRYNTNRYELREEDRAALVKLADSGLGEIVDALMAQKFEKYAEARELIEQGKFDTVVAAKQFDPTPYLTKAGKRGEVMLLPGADIKNNRVLFFPLASHTRLRDLTEERDRLIKRRHLAIIDFYRNLRGYTPRPLKKPVRKTKPR